MVTHEDKGFGSYGVRNYYDCYRNSLLSLLNAIESKEIEIQCRTNELCYLYSNMSPDNKIIADEHEREIQRRKEEISVLYEDIHSLNKEYGISEEKRKHSEYYIFICYASEDQPAASELASAIRMLGTDVWFAEWEIKPGDSIVEKINDALGKITHLIVLFSVSSVEKPWVRKELSSALMRQLSQKHVRILPVRLDDCQIPPILEDIKYADARSGMHFAVVDLERALFESSSDEDA